MIPDAGKGKVAGISWPDKVRLLAAITFPNHS
jgi:hypothetical protein